jgi:uncharacterized protein YbjT (DUF2867 family)
MRILVVGASGFVGSRLVSELLARGHSIVCAGRAPDRLRARFPGCDVLPADLGRDDTETWQGRLRGLNGVINAAGVLRHDLAAVHHLGPVALFEACARANIRHLVQISALGAGQQRHSCFLTSKDAADAHLMRLAVDQKRSGWGVLRPSVVIGRGGASTELFSALAAAPWPIRIGEGDWRIQPVHVADLARIIAELVERQSIPALLNVVGPESMTTDELTTILRAWLGLAPRPFLTVPAWCIGLGARIGDLVPGSPLSTETMSMLARGSTADPKPLRSVLGWTPRPLREALAAEPAVRADRWLARMLPVRAALLGALAVVWVGSGVASLALSPDRATALLSRITDARGALAITWSGAVLDIVLGLALLVRRHRRGALLVQLTVLTVYTALATMVVPELWADPFGPLLKNFGIFAATWALLAIED